MKKAKQQHILVIEDEQPIREMVRFALESAGFIVTEAEHGKQARSHLIRNIPSLILLDWMLPNESGISFARYLRQGKLTQTVPIIMLTAKAEEENRVRGFEVGADDYIVKPFSPRELVARIKAVLRRGVLSSPDNLIEMKDLVLSTERYEVRVNDILLDLSPITYRLLHFFLTHQKRVYSREQILHYVWDNAEDVDERTIDVHIRRLRKILAPYGYDSWIQTVRSAGYSLIVDD